MRDYNTDPRKPEVGEFENNSANKDEDSVAKTGTTTVGVTADDGVVVATDRRASLAGRFVASKDVVKVEQVTSNSVVTLVGSVGGAQSFINQLEAEASLYRSRRQKPMEVEALANLARNFARSGPFFRINPIVAGVDDSGPHVYTVDPAGGLMEDEYTVTGSGMQVAYGTLEQNYDDNLSLEEATRVAAETVESAAERDTGSGNGLALATVDDSGVTIETYPDYDVVEDM